MSIPKRCIAETFEMPRLPDQVTLRVDHFVDWRTREYLMKDPAEYISYVKQQMAADIAKALVKNTQFVSDEMILSGGELISLELTFNDRGTYQNWLPEERRMGKREGRKQVIDALPYGIDVQVNP